MNPLFPDRTIQVTVQSVQGNVPGYVQLDDVTGGVNHWSASPETLSRKGISLPDFSTLPSGKYMLRDLLKGTV